MSLNSKTQPLQEAAKVDMVRCRDGCGAEVRAKDDGTDPPGWQRFEFGRGLRCPTCQRALQAVNSASAPTTAANAQSEPDA